MAKLTIPFGKFLPDQATFKNPGVIFARNVVPKVGSYGPFRDFSVYSNALDAQVLGAAFARNSTGATFIYAGTPTKLYELVDTTFTDQSVGGGYSTATDDVWEFAVWNRNGKVIATNYTDAIQSMTIGAGASANFATMITGTNVPKAKHVGIVNQFVVLGYTNDASDGIRQSRVWWSALGNEANFDPDAATQSDFEDLPFGGAVQRLIGLNEYGLIFQRDMVRTMRYVGGGVIFEMLPLNYAPGTPIPNSVIAHKGMVFYIAEDGFFAINGTAVEPIGHGGIDKRFWDQFDIAHRRDLSVAVDPVRKNVCWAYAAESSGSSLPNRLLLYNYADRKFTEADVEIDFLMRAETRGYTLDGLDVIGTDIDNAAVFNVSFDSEKWNGGNINLAAFDRDHKLGYFDGLTKRGTIETGDIQPIDGRRWQINGVIPLIDGGQPAVSSAARTRLIDSIAYGSSASMNTDGECAICIEGRYQRLRTSISESTSWSHIQGLTIDYELTGER